MFQAIRKGRLFVASVSGVAAIEAAIVLPVMLIAYFGLVDFANAISASRRVTVTASTVADLVTQTAGSTTTKAELLGLLRAAESTMEPFNEAVSVELYGYTVNNNAVQQTWRINNGNPCSGGARGIDLAKVKELAGTTNDVVVSRVCYRIEPIVGYVMKSSIYLNDQMALRPRYNARLTCSDC